MTQDREPDEIEQGHVPVTHFSWRQIAFAMALLFAVSVLATSCATGRYYPPPTKYTTAIVIEGDR